MRNSLTCTRTTLCLLLILFTAPAVVRAAAMKDQALVKELVTKANQEGVLDVAITSGITKAERKLIAAFKKRFGLDIQVNTVRGDMAAKYVKIHATLKAGGIPDLDVLSGTGQEHMKMRELNHSMEIPNWKALLAEINPLVGTGKVKPEVVSPQPFAGASFMWSNRTRSYLYNTKLISEEELPKTLADLADPKYKGKFAVPPWTSNWEWGILNHDKQDWLKIADETGKNAAAVIRYGPALQRILLGEFAFMPSNTYYYWQVKAKDPSAPLGQKWFADYTPMTRILHVVPKNVRHPSAATLWAMWMTTPEAEAIWQPVTYQANLIFGESDIDVKSRESLKKGGSKVVTWYDNEETLKAFTWYGTTEGIAYRAAIKNAITQRK